MRGLFTENGKRCQINLQKKEKKIVKKNSYSEIILTRLHVYQDKALNILAARYLVSIVGFGQYHEFNCFMRPISLPHFILEHFVVSLVCRA